MPLLTVVGYGDTQVSPEGGWVLPGEIPAVREADAPAQQQMLSAFANADYLRIKC